MELRLFVAITIRREWQDAVTRAQTALRHQGLALRWSRADDAHLTLAFLGNVDEDRIGAIETAMGASAQPVAPFSLTFGRAGLFGSPRRPRVVWLGLDGDTVALARLQARLVAELGRVGFPPERGAFRPHITVARVPERTTLGDAGRIAPAVEALPLPATPPLHVDRIVLVRSILGGGPARYETLVTTYFQENEIHRGLMTGPQSDRGVV